MNGLDTKEWDPAVDRFLPQSARFDDAAELVDAKAHAKALLQREQGLVEDFEVHFSFFHLLCKYQRMQVSLVGQIHDKAL